MTNERTYNQFNSMMAWEQGDLDLDGTVELFQDLIDTGMAWKLQGMYGRAAHDLIGAGYCHPHKSMEGIQ